MVTAKRERNQGELSGGGNEKKKSPSAFPLVSALA